jgi:hypothetical protein
VGNRSANSRSKAGQPQLPYGAQQTEASPEEAGVLREVLSAIRHIRHGHVQIIIQDARVVQIDRTEKIRLEHVVGRRE